MGPKNMKQLTTASQRRPFSEPTRTHLIFLRSLVVLVGIFIPVALANPPGEMHGTIHVTCYRELSGCEGCKSCNNNKTNEECACLKLITKNETVSYVCDEYCVSGQGPSVAETRNWRVLGITMMVVFIGSIFGIFSYTMLKWYQTDTLEPPQPTAPKPDEGKEELAAAGPSEEGIRPGFPNWPPEPPPPPPPTETALTGSGVESGTSGSSYGSSSTEGEIPEIPATPPSVPLGPKLSTAIS